MPRRAGDDQGGARVTAQRLLQHARQLAVAVRHVRALRCRQTTSPHRASRQSCLAVGERVDDVAERGQRAVDGLGLLQLDALRPGLGDLARRASDPPPERQTDSRSV
jgi:hypothetical protein